MDFKKLTAQERRDIRRAVMDDILNNLKLAHTDKNKDAILIPLEGLMEDATYG